MLGPRLVRRDVRDIDVGLLRASQLHARSRRRVEQPSPGRAKSFSKKKKRRPNDGEPGEERKKRGGRGEADLRREGGGVKASSCPDLKKVFLVRLGG